MKLPLIVDKKKKLNDFAFYKTNNNIYLFK